jgi:hypothetical protein
MFRKFFRQYSPFFAAIFVWSFSGVKTSSLSALPFGAGTLLGSVYGLLVLVGAWYLVFYLFVKQ